MSEVPVASDMRVCTKPLRGGRCGVGLRVVWWLG
jgi:hypothetical protein